MVNNIWEPSCQNELYHFGVEGMKWGVRKDPKKGPGRRKTLASAVKDRIKRANKADDLFSYTQWQHFIDAGRMYIQQHQEFMQMSMQQAFNDMQTHMDAHMNFMNTVDMNNTMNSFYMY